MTFFYEPCAGDGALIDQLESRGHLCVSASDVVPLASRIDVADARDLSEVVDGAKIITNPPWDRALLHALIVRFSDLAPTWLLFDADWPHTSQAIPYLPRLRKIVSVGRLRWIEGTSMSGKDNCAWYLFDKPLPDAPPVFYGAGVVDHAVKSR